MELVISAGGVVRCIYEEAVDLTALGAVEIRRASHCEPDAAGAWWADLAPVDGPKLGPFSRRSAAVAAEVQWLSEHVLQGSNSNPSGEPNERSWTDSGVDSAFHRVVRDLFLRSGVREPGSGTGKGGEE